MSLIAATVSEFGRSLGLDDLELRTQGTLVLEVDRIGTLSLDRAGPAQDKIVISLARPLYRPNDVHWNHVLAASHFRSRHALPLQVGCSRDHLVFSVVLPAEEFTLTTLNDAIRLLDEQHAALGLTP